MTATSPSEDALAWLLQPFDRGHFLADYWGRTPLHVPGVAGRFHEVLDLARLDHILGHHGMRHPSVRLVRSEDPPSVEQYTFKSDHIDPMRVGRLFCEGCTVVFDSLHDRHPPLNALVSALSSQASARAQANVYLTPPGAQGFGVHYDAHDVFILQLSGHKRWRLFAGGPEAPLSSERFQPDRDLPGAELRSLELAPGDVLYVPRGVMHAAESLDEASLHVTLGVIPYTWAELLTEVLDAELVAGSPWREALPFGFGAEAETVARELTERIGALPAERRATHVLAERLQRFEASTRPAGPDYLRQALGAAKLAPSHTVGVRPGLTVRVHQHDEQLVIRVGERAVQLPARARATLDAVLTETPIRLDQVEDALDWAGRATVVQALLREGVLENHTLLHPPTTR